MTQRRIIPLRGSAPSEFRRLREQAGLTLEEARQLLEVSERTVYRYESGECEPTRLAVRTLKQAISARRTESARRPGPGSALLISSPASAACGSASRASAGTACSPPNGTPTRKRPTPSISRTTTRSRVISGSFKGPRSHPRARRAPGRFSVPAVLHCRRLEKELPGARPWLPVRHPGDPFLRHGPDHCPPPPAAFLLENVKNLESHDGGRTFATIMNVLRNELGYHVQHRVISSSRGCRRSGSACLLWASASRRRSILRRSNCPPPRVARSSAAFSSRG